ncbi:hypothetical protein CXB51_025134 [Gossypium anomalum]|uniref:Integrase zinc-binding domain-containing protein n=1 Tax=Gossypium anomalum TaxID=47600 RepID=A0A8J5Z1V9_9ROSI|nr:hypothetical protein CXB51_025134 [Gossypium anomalum]
MRTTKEHQKNGKGFVLDGDILYKKGKDQMLLRCVDDVEARKILEEVHEGICGTHANGFNMARKIMRLGYYWLTMESDCINFARKCHKCKSTAIKFMCPPSPLHVMTSPWPLLCGAWWTFRANLSKGIKRTSIHLCGHRLLHKMDRSRFVCQCKDCSLQVFEKEIICRYGLPERIISDNATNLNNKMMKEVCEQFQIKHHNSSPLSPKDERGC